MSFKDRGQSESDYLGEWSTFGKDDQDRPLRMRIRPASKAIRKYVDRNKGRLVRIKNTPQRLRVIDPDDIYDVGELTACLMWTGSENFEITPETEESAKFYGEILTTPVQVGDTFNADEFINGEFDDDRSNALKQRFFELEPTLVNFIQRKGKAVADTEIEYEEVMEGN